jgi:hypothetical protein
VSSSEGRLQAGPKSGTSVVQSWGLSQSWESCQRWVSHKAVKSSLRIDQQINLLLVRNHVLPSIGVLSYYGKPEYHSKRVLVSNMGYMRTDVISRFCQIRVKQVYAFQSYLAVSSRILYLVSLLCSLDISIV